MGKHSHYHASGAPDGHRRSEVRHGFWESRVDPPRLPEPIEAKLATIPEGPARSEFIRSLGRTGFEMGLSLSPEQLDQIYLRAEHDVAHREDTSPWFTRQKAAFGAPSLIYYIRFDDGVVKIGTTVDLERRLAALYRRPEDVLATEPGDHRLERMRHQQFEDDRIEWGSSREVFRLSDSLRSHINMLAKLQAQMA